MVFMRLRKTWVLAVRPSQASGCVKRRTLSFFKGRSAAPGQPMQEDALFTTYQAVTFMLSATLRAQPPPMGEGFIRV
jgi:hypothetical protein